MKVKDWIKILIFAVVIVGLTIGAAKFLYVPEARDATGMYGFYLEEEDSLDVVLVGPSVLYTDYYSPLAYEESDLTSYTISTGGLCGSMYRSAFREVMQTQDPDLWVVELSGFCYDYQDDPLAMRRWLDSIKKGPNRDESIEELIPEEDRESYQKSFLKYHANWPSFSWCWNTMIDKIQQKSRGYSVTKNFTAYTNFDQDDPEEYLYDFSEDGMTELKAFLAFLEDNQIHNVLFVRLPFKGEFKDGQQFLEGEEMILSAGYEILDYGQNTTNVHKEELQLDPDQDFFDKEHMTVFGAEKLTRNLARYIDSHYSIDKKRSEETKTDWDAAASYNDQILKNAKEETQAMLNGAIYTQRGFLK